MKITLLNITDIWISIIKLSMFCFLWLLSKHAVLESNEQIISYIKTKVNTFFEKFLIFFWFFLIFCNTTPCVHEHVTERLQKVLKKVWFFLLKKVKIWQKIFKKRKKCLKKYGYCAQIFKNHKISQKKIAPKGNKFSQKSNVFLDPKTQPLTRSTQNAIYYISNIVYI